MTHRTTGSMDEAALQGDNGASVISLAGNSDSAADDVDNEQPRPAEEVTSDPRESVLQFEPMRVVSPAGNYLQQWMLGPSCGELDGKQLQHELPLVCDVIRYLGIGQEGHKRRQKPRLATPLGRRGLTFSSPPHVPRVSLSMVSLHAT